MKILKELMLNLIKNNINDEGMKYLWSGLKHLTKLNELTLYLSNN